MNDSALRTNSIHHYTCQTPFKGVNRGNDCNFMYSFSGVNIGDRVIFYGPFDGVNKGADCVFRLTVKNSQPQPQQPQQPPSYDEDNTKSAAFSRLSDCRVEDVRENR